MICVYDFERENHKFEIFVFMCYDFERENLKSEIFVLVFVILGQAWWDRACRFGGLKKPIY